jgi:two-component system sensor histidine kinase BaeS
MPERAWYKSLYWRIAIGFVCFLGVTLVIQAAFFVWIVVRGERDVSAGSLDVFARMVATDLATEIAANGTANIERHVAEQFGSLPRPVWVVLRNGQVIAGRWGDLPAALRRRALMRLRMGGDLFPPGTRERTGMFRFRRFAASTIVVGGRPVGAVIVQAGRPSETVAREFGPMLLLIVTGLVIGMGGLAALVIFRPASRRLQVLAETARKLGAGDTAARAPETGGDEIAGVARAFNQMAQDLVDRAEALQASDRARRQLLADVSHELMTPLTASRGYMETLGMPSIALDEPARSRYLGIVHEESLRLERIIGDLLDLARLEAGGAPLTMEDVPVGQIFARVLARHGQAAKTAKVTLEVRGDEEILVRGDRLRLEQALQNLAANALRHTSPGGQVLLDASRRGEAAVLSVIDNGAGISPEHLPHVFDRFYKADASRREAAGAGSGLGLSIVKAIVERHGGRVTVRSKPGVETAFEIVLP